MPIYTIPGITGTHADESAIVEVARISKGVMVQGRGGVEHPSNLDYFRVNFREDLGELAALYDRQVMDKPRQLRVQLAYPTLEDSWWAWNSIYKSGGMLGLNDGVWWNYLRHPDTVATLVSDYMLTPDGIALAEDNLLLGHEICNAADVYNEYLSYYHREGYPLPPSWQRVNTVVNGHGMKAYALRVNHRTPLYRTKKKKHDKDENPYNEYYAEPEGRLFLTMPHLEGFTSFNLFTFKTGSYHDIRTLSRNLAQIVAQAKVFDSDMGSISLDAIPMKLVRRQEVISKNIDGKRVKSPEWLVHIETVSKWQRFVDEMQIRMNVQKMYAVVNHEMSGLSQTIEQLDLPEIENPIPQIQAGNADDEDPPETVEGEVVTGTSEAPSEAPAPEGAEPPPKKKVQLKERPIPAEALAETLKAGKALLADKKAEIGGNEFWTIAYGLGYSQAGATPFLDNEDFRVCLTQCIAHYESQDNEPEADGQE